MKASDLISVSFTDLTNYSQPQDNSDVLGMIFNYYWGPANTPLVLNREQFLAFYPESAPLGINYLKKPMWLYSWLSIRHAFDMGARQIEVTRASDKRHYIGAFIRYKESNATSLPVGTLVTGNDTWQLMDGTVLNYNEVSRTFHKDTTVEVDPGIYARVKNAQDTDQKNTYLIKDANGWKTISLSSADYFKGLSVVPKDIVLQGNEELFAYDEYNDKSKQNDSIDKSDDALISVALVYPGAPPATLWGYETFEVTITKNSKYGVPFTIQVSGLDKHGVRHVVESFSGSFKRQETTDGQNYFIEDVVNTQSSWIRIRVAAALPDDFDFPFSFDSEADVTGPYYTKGLVVMSLNNVNQIYTAPKSSVVENSNYVPLPITVGTDEYGATQNSPLVFADKWKEFYKTFVPDPKKEPDADSIIGDGSIVKDAYRTVFSDFELSSATLIVPTYPEVLPKSDKSYKGLHEICQQICQERSNISTVIGYPLEEVFSATQIQKYQANNLKSRRDMFTTFLAAREYVYALGFRYLMDGVAGWAGRVCDVARQVRVNQLPSAVTYGSYPGVLQDTFSFEEVLTLHELGIGSIYQSSVGPRIWDIRSLYERQESYWGKYNVVRVACAILRPIMSLALRAVHRQVSADPTERSVFETSLNEVLGDFIDSRDILSDSVAVCLDSNNSDIQTNGGEFLNIALYIHFIKVVERVRINVYATDSSVTVSFE